MMVKDNIKTKVKKREMKCPNCGGSEIVKNGSLGNGKPKNKIG